MDELNLFINITKNNKMINSCIILCDNNYSIIDTYQNTNTRFDTIKNVIRSMICSNDNTNKMQLNIITSTPNIYTYLQDIIPFDMFSIKTICTKEDIINFFNIDNTYTSFQNEKDSFNKLQKLYDIVIGFQELL